tara:strand:+ start:97 stop:1047 length:951 start_codon:yes stop_codon:yes gene_type:complete
MNYVIGNNAVSYFLAYLLENTTLILHKTLEELDYNAGQKIIPVSIIDLIKKEFEDYSIKEFQRFYDDRGKLTSVLPKNFENLYSLYTRGKTSVEKSYYSNVEKYCKYISINDKGPEESYDLLFKKIKESVNKRTLDKQLNSIDLTGRITVGEEVLDFDRIISTINIVDLVELENSGKIRDSITENHKLEGFNLPYNDRFVYVCSLDSGEDITLSNLYKQVLATGKPYFRKTYIGKKIIYESMRNIYDKDIEGNKILDYIESTQISDNLRIKKVMGIDLVGKFSEWNENINLESLYQRAHELKEFYNFSENNHKKVL